VIYETENGTQRGNSDTAIAGSISAAVRILPERFYEVVFAREWAKTG
jgi:hypothetical protein